MGESPQDPGQPLSIADHIAWGARRLEEGGLCFGHGTDNATDEAAMLVLHAAGVGFDIDARELRRPLSTAQARSVRDLIEARLSSRKPAAYLIGRAWFAGLEFYVDERVLVPRSPIAELIGEHFEPWVDPSAVRRILDLCTGSGCIAIACADAFPEARVDATDISGDALEVARINVDRHGMQERVRLVRADLFDGPVGRDYDLIVSNPPYVDAREMANLPEEYTHEPVLGLAAGADGLRLVRGILDNARRYLADTGCLVVEVGASQPALEAAYPRVPFTWLEFEHGGSGVFLLSAEELDRYEAELRRS